MLRDIPTSFDDNIKGVANMSPVSSLSGSEFGKSSIDLVTQVTDYYNSIGNFVVTKYGNVQLTRNGVKASIAHGIGRKKAIAFKAVPDVLQSGIMVDYQNNWKSRGYNTAVIAAPIVIANDEYFMAVVIEEHKKDNSYYLHEVALKRIKDTSAFKTGTPSGLTPSAKVSYIYSILRDLQNSNTSPQKNQSRDADYLSAVERGDMETAQRMVDEAAEHALFDSKIRGKDEKLLRMYHATDAEFNIFDLVMHGGENGTGEGLGIYLIDNKDSASRYGDRIVESYVDVKRPAKTWEKTITRAELADLIRAAVEKDAREMVEDEGYASLDEAKKDTWITNYVAQNDLANMDHAYKVAAEKLDRDNDRDIIRGLSFATGAVWRNQDMVSFYRDVVTPTIGVDGFWVRYKGKNGEYENVILAFDSSQVKSADPVTYDDNGDVIPLSQRFNAENQDIRYQDRYDFDDDLFGESSVESVIATALGTLRLLRSRLP